MARGSVGGVERGGDGHADVGDELGIIAPSKTMEPREADPGVPAVVFHLSIVHRASDHTHSHVDLSTVCEQTERPGLERRNIRRSRVDRRTRLITGSMEMRASIDSRKGWRPMKECRLIYT